MSQNISTLLAEFVPEKLLNAQLIRSLAGARQQDDRRVEVRAGDRGQRENGDHQRRRDGKDRPGRASSEDVGPQPTNCRRIVTRLFEKLADLLNIKNSK